MVLVSISVPKESTSANALRLATESPLHITHTTAIVLGPRMSEFYLQAPQKGSLRFPQPLGSPRYRLCWFLKPDSFRASSLQCRSQKLDCLMWGKNLSLHRKKLQTCEIPPYCGLLHWGVGFGVRKCLCLSCSSHCDPFITTRVL